MGARVIDVDASFGVFVRIRTYVPTYVRSPHLLSRAAASFHLSTYVRTYDTYVRAVRTYVRTYVRNFSLTAAVRTYVRTYVRTHCFTHVRT